MPQTPDRFPGVREDEGIKLAPSDTIPSVDGEIRYVAGSGFRFYDNGEIKPIAGGSTDFQRLVLTEDGGIVYIGDGDIVLKV